MERDSGEDRSQHVEDGPLGVDQLHPKVDQLAGVIADDVHANDPTVATLENELEQPLWREDSAAKAGFVPGPGGTRVGATVGQWLRRAEDERTVATFSDPGGKLQL